MRMNGGCFWMNDIFVTSFAFIVPEIIVFIILNDRFIIHMENACI
jgi:hypothetical protein